MRGIEPSSKSNRPVWGHSPASWGSGSQSRGKSFGRPKLAPFESPPQSSKASPTGPRILAWRSPIFGSSSGGIFLPGAKQVNKYLSFSFCSGLFVPSSFFFLQPSFPFSGSDDVALCGWPHLKRYSSPSGCGFLGLLEFLFGEGSWHWFGLYKSKQQRIKGKKKWEGPSFWPLISDLRSQILH